MKKLSVVVAILAVTLGACAPYHANGPTPIVRAMCPAPYTPATCQVRDRAAQLPTQIFIHPVLPGQVAAIYLIGSDGRGEMKFVSGMPEANYLTGPIPEVGAVTYMGLTPSDTCTASAHTCAMLEQLKERQIAGMQTSAGAYYYVEVRDATKNATYIARFLVRKPAPTATVSIASSAHVP
jgi:hypothetical protein